MSFILSKISKTILFSDTIYFICKDIFIAYLKKKYIFERLFLAEIMIEYIPDIELIINMLVYNRTAHAPFILFDNELFRVESCRVERARHESCRYQKGSSPNLSLSRGLVTRVVVF